MKKCKYTEKDLVEYKELLNNLYEHKNALDAYERKHSDIGHFYIHTLSKFLFEENPKLKSFAWNHYTPSFNDGDPCTNSCMTYCPLINELDVEDGYDEDDLEETGCTKEEIKDMFDKVAAFLSKFNHDDLERWFGTDVTITVTSDKVDTDSYYCGY